MRRSTACRRTTTMAALGALCVGAMMAGCMDNSYERSGGNLLGSPGGGYGAACGSDQGGDGLSQAYAVDWLAVGDSTVGFDLDGVDTPSECSDALCAEGPSDGPGGIDNRLGTMLQDVGAAIGEGFDANQALAEAIATSQLVLLSRLVDVDDWSDDGCVDLYFYVGHDPAASGTPSAGRSYQVDAISLAGGGGDLDSPLIAFEDAGEIDGGTFFGGPSVFELSVPLVEGLEMQLRFHNATIRFAATPGGAADGVLGGYVTIHDILAGMSQIPEAQEYMTLVGGVLRNQADIDAVPAGQEIANTRCTPDNVFTYTVSGEGCGSPDYTCSPSGRCVEPENHFDALSVGIRFTAVPVTIDGVYSGPSGW